MTGKIKKIENVKILEETFLVISMKLADAPLESRGSIFKGRKIA